MAYRQYEALPAFKPIAFLHLNGANAPSAKSKKMDYTAKIASHEKAIRILDLLEKAVKRLRCYENNLYMYNQDTGKQRWGSFYRKGDLEFDVKKGERSVSFITGMYERFAYKEFGTPDWISMGYKITTELMQVIDMTGGIDLESPYKDVLRFPLPEDFVDMKDMRIVGPDLATLTTGGERRVIDLPDLDFWEFIFPKGNVQEYDPSKPILPMLQEMIERQDKMKLAGLVEPVSTDEGFGRTC